MESWLWNPGCGILALESRLWNPGCGILAVESWLWNPGCGIMAVEVSGGVWRHQEASGGSWKVSISWIVWLAWLAWLAGAGKGRSGLKMLFFLIMFYSIFEKIAISRARDESKVDFDCIFTAT